jgi:hypothetical protein
MPAVRFFRFVERLVTYQGALQARVRAEMMHDDAPRTTSVQRQESRRSLSAVGPNDTVEYADDGTRVVNGVAVNDAGVPLWVTRLPGYNPNDCVVLPADVGLGILNSAPSFHGQFSYSQVTGEVTDDGG